VFDRREHSRSLPAVHAAMACEGERVVGFAVPGRERAHVVMDEVPGEDHPLPLRPLTDGDEDDRVDQLRVGEPAVEVPLVGPLLDVDPPVQDGVDASGRRGS
jgi:hypothetical protein